MANAYLEKQKVIWCDGFNTGERIGSQKIIDMVQVALRMRLDLGEKDIAGVIEEIKQLLDYFAPAYDVRHEECDWYREQLDRALSESCGPDNPLIPWDVRNADMKKVRYGSVKK